MMSVLSSSVICFKNGVTLFNTLKNLVRFSNYNLSSYNARTIVRPVLNFRNYNLCVLTNLRKNNVSKFGAVNIFSNQLKSKYSLASTISPLQGSKKSRISRKKALGKEDQFKYNSVIAYATADAYNLDVLRGALLKDTLYTPTDIEDFNCINVLYAVAPSSSSSSSSGEPKQIYFFQEGAVVFWNVPEDECLNILKFIKNFEDSSYNELLIFNEQEVMPYLYTGDLKRSDLANNQILLVPNKDSIEAALDKYTFSNSMALSVKLAIWEGLLEHHIASIELLTKDLKLGNKIKISRAEVLKKTGEIFALRHSVNLSSDVLDIPDFYWDRDELEKLYVKMINYFSITRRTKVVNEKLSHCLELLDLLSSNINDEHHVRLEQMIIALIMVEVGIAIIHLII